MTNERRNGKPKKTWDDIKNSSGAEVKPDLSPLDEYDEPNPSAGPAIYGERRSQATPRPLDAEGIGFMTNHEVGRIFGINHHNSKRVAYTQDVPQWKQFNGTRAGRTWYSLSEMVAHVGKHAGVGVPDDQKTEDHLKMAPWHKHLSEQLDAERANLAARKESGETPGNLWNQEHPDNKDIDKSMRHFPQGRPFTVDAPEAEGDASEYNSGFSSDLDNPIRHGYSVPASEMNPSKPAFEPLSSQRSRVQRRGQS
jgi:hypothetical protein